MHTKFCEIYFLENCHLEEGVGRVTIRWSLLNQTRKLVGGQYSVQWQISPIALLKHRVLLSEISVVHLL
jgi:hypothetical protein